MTTILDNLQWKPFSLTHVTYPTDDSVYAPILALLSLTPPFGVCALTTATVIYKDVVAAYLLVGTLISALISAILKRLIQEPRPGRYDDNGDTEFGMPSNHSCFAWFIATFAVMYVVNKGDAWAAKELFSRRKTATMIEELSTDDSFNERRQKLATVAKLWNFLHTSFTICVSVWIALGCAYSRIYLGYHTAGQVYAGSVLGMTLGIAWYRLFRMDAIKRWLIFLDKVVAQLEIMRNRDISKGEVKSD